MTGKPFQDVYSTIFVIAWVQLVPGTKITSFIKQSSGQLDFMWASWILKRKKKWISTLKNPSFSSTFDNSPLHFQHLRKRKAYHLLLRKLEESKSDRRWQNRSRRDGIPSCPIQVCHVFNWNSPAHEKRYIDFEGASPFYNRKNFRISSKFLENEVDLTRRRMM